jgi:protocatechuate 3,4-dioxygenase beta subunit
MRAALFVTAFVTAAHLPLAAQDVEFIRALERAQGARPAALQSVARIAPATEPGTPLVIRGRAVGTDGRSPLANAVVFAYHTDRSGLYDRPEAGAHSWRLRGWARTDAEGRFEFQTIRPGAYPSSRIPAHVHFTLFTDGGRYHAGELRFEDDPYLTARDRENSKREGEFGDIRPVRREGAGEIVEVALRVNPGQRF